MPQGDEEFVDFVLNTISDDIKRLGHFSNGLLDSIDKQFNSVAHSVRGALHTSPWVPDKVRPTAPPTPRSADAPLSSLERLQGWVDRNRAITAAIVAFVGTGAFYMWRVQRRSRRAKSRAKRAPSGAKTEVVILAGSPYSLLTQSLAGDFECRGFLVFIPVSSIEEESAIADLRLSDVRPLNFDITSTESTQNMLERFASYLSNPQRHGTMQLHLASLVIADIDASAYPTASVQNIPPSLWLDSINSHIVYPISLIHTFLPLLTSSSSSSFSSSTKTQELSPSSKGADSTATIVVLTQSNVASIEPADHAVESLSTAALASYTRTLQLELPRGCHAIHLRLGSYETEAKRKHPRTDAGYVRSVQSRHRAALSPHGRRMEELHLAVFDAVTGRSRGTVFVGPGARTYALIGALAPRSLVHWMMGERPASVLRRARDSWRRGSHGGGSSSSESEGGVKSIEWEKVSSS